MEVTYLSTRLLSGAGTVSIQCGQIEHVSGKFLEGVYQSRSEVGRVALFGVSVYQEARSVHYWATMRGPEIQPQYKDSTTGTSITMLGGNITNKISVKVSVKIDKRHLHM